MNGPDERSLDDRRLSAILTQLRSERDAVLHAIQAFEQLAGISVHHGRSRGRPLGSRNKPKAAAGEVSPARASITFMSGHSQKFFAIFDHVRDYQIYTITLDGYIEEWNQSLQRFAGWLAADVQGRSMSMFFPQDDPDRPHLDVLLAEALRIGSTEREGWRLKRDGSRLWVNSVITALPDESGAVRGFVVVCRDLTERKRQEDEMKKQATVDPLTGAYNRRKGDAFLAVEFSRWKRDGQPFAVLMLDIDDFKAINDRFGHAAGYAVLCALVEACQKTLRPVDIVMRWGGEEFLIVLPNTGAADALSAAERLRAVVIATRVTAAGGGSIHFTISIGVALPDADSPSELLRRSDEALYAAKSGGRNRVILAS